LEFDAVILTDADAATYTPDTLDARLLYVALTRASHELHICWVGELSPYLNPDGEGVVCQPPMGDALIPHPVTIAEYVKHTPHVNADWCVTRLAGAGKLDLLQAGQIDETVLDVLVQTFASEKAEPEEESVVEPLDATSTRGIEMHVMEIETNPDGGAPDEALALLQLAYGLLRNSLRKVGIPVLAEGAGQLPTEVVQMVTLKRAVDQGETVLAIPGRTTRRRALQAVDEKRKPLAESYLDHLIDHGVVAVQPNVWLQIPQGQLYPLLALSLGFPAQDWDLDLVEALPRLPLPMDLKQLVLQEVPHARAHVA
jgi:DNA helicase-2/ATP-dependent DNA helicase PcrA